MLHKRICIVLLAILTIALAGCSSSPIQETPSNNAAPQLNESAEITDSTQPETAQSDDVPTAVLSDEEPESAASTGPSSSSGGASGQAQTAPLEGLAVVESDSVSVPAQLDAHGQPIIQQPGRAEPPRPEPTLNVKLFRLAKQAEKPSEPSIIEWDVEGVESVQITRVGGQYGEAGEQWTVPANGTMEHTFPQTTAGFEITYLLSGVNSSSVASQFAVTVPCEYSWVFDFRDPSLLCPGRPVISDAAFQVFEGGIMLWLGAEDKVLYSSWDGAIHAELEDTYQHGVDLVTDPEIVAPNGYYQPDYGLGKVWRDHAEARIVLGWALAPNIGYQAIRQGEPLVPFGDLDSFVMLPDNGYLHIQSEGNWDVQYNYGEIPLASVRPPVAEGAIPEPAATAPIDTGISVDYFRFTPSPTRPSDIVQMEWSVEGVSSVTITRLGGENGEANETYNVAASGRLEQRFSPTMGGMPIVYRLTSVENEGFSAEYVIDLPCEYAWLISVPRGNDCPTKVTSGLGAQQDFEHGFLIWISEEDLMVYSTWDGSSHGFIDDTFVFGTDIISDPNIVPPAGYYQPDYGFGKVWREEPGLRDLLGWGVTPAKEYTVYHQADSLDGNGTEYITMLNGGMLTIEQSSDTWIVGYLRQ